MPTYDYFCQANGKTVEVNHKMSVELATWGELCDAAGLEPGETPPQTAVTKLATGGQIVRNSSLKDGPAPCDMSNCCGGVCGLNE